MSGKSVTHRKSKSEPESEPDRRLTEVKPWISAMRNRIRPSTSQAISHFPAAKKIQSPSSICNLVRSDSFSASEKNFTIGDFHSPFSTLMKARPFAPNVFAIAVISSTWPIVIPAKCLALIALTTPPSASARSEEHTSELQSRRDLVCRLLLEKKKKKKASPQRKEKKKIKH